MQCEHDLVLLEQALAELLPAARLGAQPVPGCAGLELLLLEDTLAAVRLDDEIALRLMERPLYWVFCWASGQVLAEQILAHPEWVAGKRVLDFGAGSGVVAIAAALAGAREVIACDLDPLARAAARWNAAHNGVALTTADDFAAVTGPVDVITAADVLYDRENLPWLDRLAQRADAVLLADSRIRDFSHDSYGRLMQVDSCTVPDLDESREFRTVTLYASGALVGTAA